MRRNYTWFGPGRGYDRPDSGDDLLTHNMYGRQGTQPLDVYRARQGAGNITAPGGQNRSGQDWANVHAGVENADLKSRSENFKF